MSNVSVSCKNLIKVWLYFEKLSSNTDALFVPSKSKNQKEKLTD